MRDSVPSGSYSSVCNVLRQWTSRSFLLIESVDSMIGRRKCGISNTANGSRTGHVSTTVYTVVTPVHGLPVFYLHYVMEGSSD